MSGNTRRMQRRYMCAALGDVRRWGNHNRWRGGLREESRGAWDALRIRRVWNTIVKMKQEMFEETAREFKWREPPQPFVVELTDGRCIEIDDPRAFGFVESHAFFMSP